MPKPQHSTIPDAAESNAGDDYHIVYAVRKSLELLNFSSNGLKALSLEGLFTSDESLLDPKSLLGIDLTEYFGGYDLSTATSVVISQLKYSTRHATKDWTAAELCQGKKKGSAGSVIDRLGQLYRDLVKTKPVDQHKLTVKLVSNRPVAKDLDELIKDLKALQAGQKKRIAPTLYKDNVIVKRLILASNIPVTEILGFLLALDFSDCGSGSSLYQKSRSYETISKLGNLDSRTQFAKLRELVSDRMLPRNRGRNTLTKEDILFEFSFSELGDLLPVTNKISIPVNVVLREQLTPIIRSIIDPLVSVACLHGSAGIGKSTLMSAIPGELPEGSKAIIYDCYGGGAYNDSEDRRHRPEYAFLQLCNQLALDCGTPFLLVRNGETGQLLKELKKRLIDAVSMLKSVHPKALLVLLIDAADNSISASRHFQSECFVGELANMGLPAGCKVIFSARTERVATLNLAENALPLAIQPFSDEETTSFLSHIYGFLEHKIVIDFKNLTHGIPRVMSYVMDSEGDTLAEKTAFLRPKGKTLDQIFAQRIKEAKDRAGDNEAINKFLGSLVAFPSPVPEILLSIYSGLNFTVLTDLRTDLWHGLIYDNGSYLFRDEDFETFIRTKYKTTTSEYKAIANILLAEAGTNDYASIHLGAFLFHAGMSVELSDIVINKEHLAIPADPIKNKEVYIERVRLAMRLADKKGLGFFKLQFIAAEAAKSNELIENILRNHAELAAAYGDLQTNQKLYFGSGNPHWFGPAHFRNAAIFSRDPKTHALAREHLNKANSWLNYRDHLPDEESHDYEFSAKDIAYGAEAFLRISGLKRCAAYIRSWTPKSFGFEIFEELLKILIPQETNQQLNRWLRNFDLRADLRITAVSIFFRFGLKVGFAWKDIKYLPKKLSLNFQEKLIGYLEFALANGLTYLEALPLLGLITIKPSQYLPGFYHSSMDDNGIAEMDLLFRVKTIHKLLGVEPLLLSDLYPEYMRKALASDDYKESSKYKDDKAKLDRLYRHLLRVYDCRAGFVLRKVNEKVFNAQLKETIKQIAGDWELRYYHEYHYQRIYSFMMQKLLDAVVFSKKQTALHTISEGFDPKKANNIDARLKLAARLSQRHDYHDFSLRLLQSIESTIKNELLPGSEIMDYYTQATVIASRVSRNEGKYYFDQLVLASAEIDEEAYDQIRCIKTISLGQDFRTPELAFKFASYVEYCSIKLGDGEHFPWEEAISSIAAIDTASLWPISCRWDHRNIRQQKHHVCDITLLSLQAGIIDRFTAAALLAVNPYFVYGAKKLFRPIIEITDASADKIFKNAFLKDFLHDLKLHSSPKMDYDFADQALELVKDGKYADQAIIDDFKSHIQLIEQLTGPIRKKEEKQKIRKKPQLPVPVKKQLKNVVIDVNLDLGAVLVAARQISSKTDRHYFETREIFGELRVKSRGGKEQFYLDGLANLNDDHISYFDYKQALNDTFSDWQHLAIMKNWRKTAFESILINWFSALAAYRSIDYTSLKNLQALFEASDAEVARIINNYFPEHLEYLPAGTLYNLFRLNITDLPANECHELMEWALNRWSEPIADDFGDGRFTIEFNPPQDKYELITSFFQYNLGHPVRALRWRAAHSIRRLVAYDQNWIIKNLLSFSNDRHISPFQDHTNVFFWMSSRLYISIAIEKIVYDYPARMRQFSSQLFRELINNDLPHTQIKYFLRSACLHLEKIYPGTYTVSELGTIRKAISPVRRLAKSSGTLRPRIRREELKAGIRFHFDQTDTIPYWYDELASVFDVETHELIAIIDKMIAEDWGFTGDANKLNHVKADYGKTQNDHGAEPTIENLQTYFEYHGMFCAASELLKSKGTLKKDARASWENWIADWGLAWPGTWLGDMRDPIPFESRFWELKHPDNEWEFTVQPDDFHERVGSLIASTTITLEEDSYVYFGKDHERVRIQSGLVHSDTAPALLAALQTNLGYDNYIPHTSDFIEDIEEELKSADKKFLTESLISSLDNSNSGIDDKDPIFNDYLKKRIVPSKMVTNVLGVKTDTKFEVWNNTSKDHYYDGFSTSGHRFKIEKDALLELLGKRNRCLIITCAISRDLERSKRDYEGYLTDYCLIYLIYPNGNAHTITGHHQIR